MKVGLFLSLAVFALFLSSTALAQENLTGLEEFGDAELQTAAGITPDNFFYFVEDIFLSKFRDDLANKEKKIAEIRAMLEEGKIEEAKTALAKYESYAEKLQKEIEPEKSDEARRSAAAIQNTLRKFENRVPENERGNFVNNVLANENAILTSAEIANKVKQLCETLSKLDPVQYAEACKANTDTPKWQRDLDAKLTDEQKQEAEQFYTTMSQCFKDPANCPCEKFTIKKFSELCSEVAPLVAACRAGDQAACEKEREIDTDPSEILPPHLLATFSRLENNFKEAEFEHYLPPECSKAGATTRLECEKVMFRVNAPPECVEAFEKGLIRFEGEGRAFKECERIMFEKHAPQECIEAGIRDPRECSKLSFRTNAPPECVKAGITGENRDDPRKCEEILRQSRAGSHPQPVNFPINCREISDSNARLACYDSALGIAQVNTAPTPPSQPVRAWPEPCEKANAFTEESCKRIMEEFYKSRPPEPSPIFPPPTFTNETAIQTTIISNETTQTTTVTTSNQTTETTQTPTSTSNETTQTTQTSTSNTTSNQPTTITGSIIKTENPFLNYLFGTGSK